MAKVAAELERALTRRQTGGHPGGLAIRTLGQGPGWTVEDVICTSGPEDPAFEEAHDRVRIVLVVAGTFQCRSTTGTELLTPGSLMLGNQGQCYECGHDHARGDRCVSFGYAREHFERLAGDAGFRGGRPGFAVLRVPPTRAMAPVVARACAGLIAAQDPAELSGTWEELSLDVVDHAIRLTADVPPAPRSPQASVVARVTDIVRGIERNPSATLTLRGMADDAGASPYHFLRAFRRVTGVTPHQYLLRARLRDAALRLTIDPARVLDVALDGGFGDVSNFNHAFRAEFGMSPRAYRRHMGVSQRPDVRRS